MNDVYIYHELQESNLCGQHCLNNLVQEQFFDPVYLSTIARELDEEEESIVQSGGVDARYGCSYKKSSNVDESGNFSIQVLSVALKRTNNIDLEQNSKTFDPLKEFGFIVNRSKHWFTIRKIRNKWWNLNSTLEKPEYISDFYLSAFLTQLKADGYSVFTAKGLERISYNSNTMEHIDSDVGKWYRESELLGSSGGYQKTNDKTTTFTAFSGTGYRLGGAEESNTHETDEDENLAKAIQMSLNTDDKNHVETKDKATLMREKRLAALERRGL